MSTYAVLGVAFALAAVLFWWEPRERRSYVPQYVWWEQEPDGDDDCDGPYVVDDTNWAMVCEWVDYVAALPSCEEVDVA